jgi:hypothetical protein
MTPLEKLFTDSMPGPWTRLEDGTLISPNCTFVMRDGKIVPKIDTSIPAQGRLEKPL